MTLLYKIIQSSSMCGKMPSLLLNRPLPEFRRLSPQINQPFLTMATLLQHAKTLPVTFSCYQKIPPTAKIPVNFKIPTKLAIAVRWLSSSLLNVPTYSSHFICLQFFILII